METTNESPTLSRLRELLESMPATDLLEAWKVVSGRLRSAELPEVAISRYDDDDKLVPVDAAADQDLAGLVTICPYDDCREENSIREVDISERWNYVRELCVESGELYARVREGDTWYETLAMVCDACERPVSFTPDFAY